MYKHDSSPLPFLEMSIQPSLFSFHSWCLASIFQVYSQNEVLQYCHFPVLSVEFVPVLYDLLDFEIPATKAEVTAIIAKSYTIHSNFKQNEGQSRFPLENYLYKDACI